jgi:hypothetical protein
MYLEQSRCAELAADGGEVGRVQCDAASSETNFCGVFIMTNIGKDRDVDHSKALQ